MAFKGKQITAACEGGSLMSAIYLCSELAIALSTPEFLGVFLVTDWAN